jgi:hypothetical protein
MRFVAVAFGAGVQSYLKRIFGLGNKLRFGERDIVADYKR